MRRAFARSRERAFARDATATLESATGGVGGVRGDDGAGDALRRERGDV